MELLAEESNGFEKPHIPEGLHYAEFTGSTDAPDGKFGARIALDFVVYFSKEQQPVKLGRVFGKKLTPKAQLWEALESIGANLELGKNIDTDTLLGNKCRVMVEDYKDNEGKTVSGITKVKIPDNDVQQFIDAVKSNMPEQAPSTNIGSEQIIADKPVI